MTVTVIHLALSKNVTNRTTKPSIFKFDDSDHFAVILIIPSAKILSKSEIS